MELEQRTIEPVHDQNLREWLHQSHFDTLIEVLSSMAFAKEVKAANELSEWKGGEFPQYQDAALKTAKEVASLNDTIELLRALRDQKEPYMKSTARPSD